MLLRDFGQQVTDQRAILHLLHDFALGNLFIAPDIFDAWHVRPCLIDDVPFFSGQRVTDQRANVPLSPCAFRFKRPAGTSSAGQTYVIFQSHQLESA